MRYEPDVSSGATAGSLATLYALRAYGCFYYEGGELALQ